MICANCNTEIDYSPDTVRRHLDGECVKQSGYVRAATYWLDGLMTPASVIMHVPRERTNYQCGDEIQIVLDGKTYPAHVVEIEQSATQHDYIVTLNFDLKF